jgi:hypothetical protein
MAYQRGLVTALLRGLRDFGYPDLTEPEIVAALDCFFEGREAKNVIEMLVASELKQAGATPRTKPASSMMAETEEG